MSDLQSIGQKKDDVWKRMEAEMFGSDASEPNDDVAKIKLNATQDIEPDRAAKQLDMAEQTGLPIETVRSKEVDIWKRMEAEMFDAGRIKRESPNLAKLMENPAYAPVVKPDVDKMWYIERLYRGNMQDFSKDSATSDYGRIGVKRMLFGDESLDADENMFLSEFMHRKNVDYDLNYLERAPGIIAGTSGRIVSALTHPDSLAIIGTTTAIGARKGAIALGLLGNATGVGLAAPEELVTVPVGAVAGGVGGAASGAVLVLKLDGFISETGAAFNEYVNIVDENGEKIEREVAMGGAVVNGLIAGGVEAFANTKLVQNFGGIDKLMKKLGKDEIKRILATKIGRETAVKIGSTFIKSGILEGSTEAIQESVNIAVGELQKLFSSKEFGELFGDVEIEDGKGSAEKLSFWMAQLPRFEEAFATGAIGGGGFGATAKAIGLGIENFSARRQFKADQAVIEDRKNLLRDLELGKRSPKIVKQFLEGMPPEDYYINAENVKTFFQDEAQLNEFFSKVPAAAEQYQDALEAGGDLVIPHEQMDQLWVETSETKQFDGLQEFLKREPTAMTDAEMEQRLNEEIQGFDLPDNTDLTPAERLEQRVESDVLNLKNRRVNSPTSAKLYASLFRNTYETYAQRIGENPELESLLNDLFDRIQIKDGNTAQRLTKADGLDILLNRIRQGGTKPLPNESLLGFIRKQGGISTEDQLAGDIAQLDPDVTNEQRKDGKGNKLKAKAERILREGGRTLDDLALAAWEAGYFPEFGERPDLRVLVGAIEDELRGQPRFVQNDEANQNQQRLDEEARFSEELGRLGIDIASPNTDIKRELEEANQSPENVAYSIIQGFEGYAERPYWDVNAYRAGFGSDTTTLADGTVVKITKGMRVTRADSERDLARRTKEFMDQAASDVGQQWESLTPAQQAVMTSLAYNYGSVPERVTSVIAAGGDVEQAIRDLGADNDGVNEGRRNTEADIFAGKEVSPPGVRTFAQTREFSKTETVEQELQRIAIGEEARLIEETEQVLQDRFDGVDNIKDVLERVSSPLGLTDKAELDAKLLVESNRVDAAELILAKSYRELERAKNDTPSVDVGHPKYAEINSDLRKREAESQRLYNSLSSIVPAKTNVSGIDRVASSAKSKGADVSFSENDNNITVSKIKVPEGSRNQGIGSDVLGELIDYSESIGKPIALSPSTDFGGNKAGLERLYKRLGFVKNKGKNKDFSTKESYIRYPKGETKTLFQTIKDKFKDKKRGSVTFDAPNMQTIIEVFDGGDLSTILHESGHVFLEMQRVIAEQENAPQQIKDDYDSIRSWLFDIPDLKTFLEKSLSAKARKKGEFDNILGQSYEFDFGDKIIQASIRETSDTIYLNSISTKVSSDLSVVAVGSGIGTNLINDMRKYADITGKSLIIPSATNKAVTFWDKFAWLNKAGRMTFSDGDDIITTDNNYIYKAKPLAIETKHHEKFARGFEAYLFEGKAPSLELKNAFQRFKSWLVAVYKNIANLDVKLTDEVRGVFDRMLATDEAIEQIRSQATFRPNPEMADILTKAEYEAYVNLYNRSMEQAKDDLLKETLKDLKKRDTEWWKNEYESLRKEIESTVNTQPIHRAVHWLRTGEDFNTTLPVKLEHTRLRKVDIRDDYDAGYIDALPRGAVAASGGIHPQLLADYMGFTDGQTMLDQMANYVERKEVIESLVQEEMIRRHGDMLFDNTMAEKAELAVENTIREKNLFTELQAVSRKAKSKTATSAAYKSQAYKMIDGKPLNKLRPNDYYRAEVRYARESGKHLKAKDYVKAAEAKRKELLNHHLYKAATEARRMRDKLEKHVKRFGKDSTRASIDKESRDQIDSILQRFGLYQNAKLQKTDVSFSDYAKAREADGDVVYQPPIVLGQGSDYRQLSVEDVRDIFQTIRNVEALGREQRDILVGAEKLTAAEARQKAIESILANNKQNVRVDKTDGYYNRLKKNTRNIINNITRIEFIVKEMDGGKVNGATHQAVINPLRKAAGERFEMLRKYRKQMGQILDANPDVKKWGKSKLYTLEDGRQEKMSKSQVVMIALNMGNQGNMKNLTHQDGHNYSERDIDMFKAELSKSDWDTVQQIWDMFESLRPDIERVNQKMTNLDMKVVQAEEVITPYGTYRGGYMPIVYDPEGSFVGARNEESVQVNESNFEIPSVGRGFTKKRSNFAAQVLLDFDGVIQGHLSETIQFITHAQAIRQVNRITSHRDFRDAVNKTLGTATVKEFRPWLSSIARNAVYDSPITGLDKFLRHLRVGTSTIYLGFSTGTGFKQILGLASTEAAVTRGDIKQKHYLKALRDMATKPQQSTKFAFEHSSMLRERFEGIDADTSLIYKTNRGKGTFSTIQRAGFAPIVYTQVFAVDIPTWQAGYLEGLDRHDGNHEQAVSYADAVLSQTQGSGTVMDLARVQRGSEGMKAVAAMFGTYMIGVLTPMMRQAYRDSAVRKKHTKAALTLIPMIVLPALLESYMSGDEPEDDETWAEWALLKSTLYGVSAVPIVGGIAGAFGKEFDYRLSPISSAINTTVYGYKNLTGDDPGDAAIRGAAVAIGLTFKLPTYQPYKLIDEIVQIQSGEDEASFRELFLGAPDDENR